MCVHDRDRETQRENVNETQAEQTELICERTSNDMFELAAIGLSFGFCALECMQNAQLCLGVAIGIRRLESIQFGTISIAQKS